MPCMVIYERQPEGSCILYTIALALEHVFTVSKRVPMFPKRVPDVAKRGQVLPNGFRCCHNVTTSISQRVFPHFGSVLAPSSEQTSTHLCHLYLNLNSVTQQRPHHLLTFRRFDQSNKIIVRSKSASATHLYHSSVMALCNQLNDPSSMDQIPALVNSCASLPVSNETNNTSTVMAPSEEMPNPAREDQTPTLVKCFASLSVSDDGATTSTASEAKSPNLDTLPNELLDKIIEESLELNMTLTSTKIAAKISRRRRIARSLTLLSLCRSDIANNLNLNPASICAPLGLSHPLTEDDRKVLQKHVLNGDWLTVNMLKLAIGEIHEAYIQKHWVDAGIKIKPSYIRAFEERWLASNGVMERKLELCGVDAFGEDTSFVIEDPFVIELNGVEELDSDQYDAFGVLQVVAVSDRLLAPPITDSKLELLYFLWRSQSATARWQMTFSEPTMREAVQHAISTGDLDYTCLLVDIRSHSTLDGSSSSVKAEDFLTAAKYNQARILQILMEFDSRDFPRNDPSIKHWARVAKDKGDGFGGLVLEFMQAQNVQPGRHSFSTFLFRSGYVPYNFQLWNAVLDMINVLGERFGV